MLGMMNVGRRKLGRVTSNSFGKDRMLFEQSLDIAEGLTPVCLAMASSDWPASSKERMVLC